MTMITESTDRATLEVAAIFECDFDLSVIEAASDEELRDMIIDWNPSGRRMRLSIEDIRIGAIYRMTVRCKLSRETVEALLVSRAGIKQPAAKTLAGHWFTTDTLRPHPSRLSPAS